MTRAEKVATITRYRAAGYSQRDMAALFGVTRSTVANLLCDPTGAKSKARKDSYGGACVTCGGR